ncbi:alpha/beta hydrolase [Plantibacter flavus]|uniref:alpha/beta hydrolase family protein n=1 Tax=Plantibacter flavus TaxID=150123 RepID=UPI003F153A82
MTLTPISTSIDGRTLRGTIYRPPHATGPLPTAVLLHGFGSNRMESGLFTRLGRALADAGVVSAAFDRTGQGESDGSFTDISVERDLADALGIVRAVAPLDIVDDTRIHLIGMSMGAVIASVAAAQLRGRIRSLTMLSPAASFADEIGSGTLQGRTFDTAEELGYFDFSGSRLGTDFLKSAPAFDVYGSARGYGGPVRVLHGTADFIPVAYAERYREIYPDRAEITLIDGADHGWASVPTRDLVVSEVVEFVTTHSSLD